MARTARTARPAPSAEPTDPYANATVTEEPGRVTITFRTDGTYPVSDSGKSRTVAKVGYAMPYRTADGVVIQLNAFRIVPKAERA